MITHEYKVNPSFAKEIFVNDLRAINVECCATENGIRFDMEALLNARTAAMPYLIHMNLRFMQCTVHTVKL